MKKAAWVIPSFFEGSGGCRTIFQHIQYMSKEYECDVYVYDVGDFRNEKQMKKVASKLYGISDCDFFLGVDISTDKEYDIVIATSWYTVESVSRYSGKAKKYYFVQDYEPMFYSVGDEYIKARNTYLQGLKVITIGKWLAWKINREFDCEAQYFDFCVDKSKYYRISDMKKENAICFICQPEKSRRCTSIGLEALKLVKKKFPDIIIYLYGSSKKVRTDFEYVNKGIISVEECNQLYNKCRVGLCISATNPSRIPFEMMSTGLPVVDIYGENNLYDYPDDVINLAQSSPSAIAQAIIDILTDKKAQNEIVDKSLEFMAQRDLNFGFSQFMEILNSDVITQMSGSTVQQQYNKMPIIAREELIAISNGCSPVKNETIVNKLKHNYWIRKIPGIKKIAGLLNR